MYSLKYSNNTDSIYEHSCQVVHPCFCLMPGDKIIIVTGLEPKLGDLVLVRFNGLRKIGRVCKAGIQLPDETIALSATLIGVIT